MEVFGEAEAAQSGGTASKTALTGAGSAGCARQGAGLC